MTPNRLLPLLLLLALLAPCVVGYTMPDGSVVTYKCSCRGEDCGTLNATETIVDSVTSISCNQEEQHYTTKAFSYNVDEPITYPQEYYTLKETSDNYYNDLQHVSKMTYRVGDLISVYELRRQTILMEKQNEMLAEQMRWQRNATLRCIAGRSYCSDYAWVGGA